MQFDPTRLPIDTAHVLFGHAAPRRNPPAHMPKMLMESGVPVMHEAW